MPSFHSKSDLLRRLLFLLDVSTVILIFLLSLIVVPKLWPEKDILVSVHYGLLPLIMIGFVMSRAVLERKLDLGRFTISTQVTCLINEVVVAVTVSLLFVFLLRIEEVSRTIIVFFSIASIIVLVVMRLLIIWWYFVKQKGASENHLNVLVVGSGRRARVLTARLEAAFEWGVNIVGYLDPLGVSAGRRSSDEILGHVKDIGQVLRDHVVEEVIIAVPRSLLGDIQSIVDSCREEGVRLRFMADFYDLDDTARVQLSMVENIPLLSFEFVAPEDNALIAKRIFDIIVTIAALPIIAPLLLLVALAIKIDSRGPAFFVQQRVGLHKRRFPMYKFRSMVVDAEERMKEIEHLNEAEGANFKIKDDPRITRLGKFIRRTSIDELPQLINVLMGDMSLVGPRPMSNRDVSLFDKGKQRKRFSVRPGITGLWQVSGRSDLSFDQWIDLDLDYIDRWSFGLDLKILLKTVPAVLKGSGAV